MSEQEALPGACGRELHAIYTMVVVRPSREHQEHANVAGSSTGLYAYSVFDNYH